MISLTGLYVLRLLLDLPFSHTVFFFSLVLFPQLQNGPSVRRDFNALRWSSNALRLKHRTHHTLHCKVCVYVHYRLQSLTLSIQIDGSFLYIYKYLPSKWTIFNFLNDNKMLTGALSPSLFVGSSFFSLLLVFVITCIQNDRMREKSEKERQHKKKRASNLLLRFAFELIFNWVLFWFDFSMITKFIACNGNLMGKSHWG